MSWIAIGAAGALGCGDDDGPADPAMTDAGPSVPDAAAADAGGGDAGPIDVDAGPGSGAFLTLSYNVAGLPMELSGSMPAIYTPMIGPLLNDYDLVLLQESWLTPDPNPGAPLRVYHEILVEHSMHPYKTEPAAVPWGMDPERPDALLGDGLNVFSDFPLGETTRVRWPTCVMSASDCLALKGFSMNRVDLGAGSVDLYNLHAEAGETPEDDDARDLGITTLLAFMAEHSEGRAVIVGGDFNLHTDEEPAATQFARFLDEGGLRDACTELDCDRPGAIDKITFRSAGGVTLTATSYSVESDVFAAEDGGAPLSDHEPLAVRFTWTSR